MQTLNGLSIQKVQLSLDLSAGCTKSSLAQGLSAFEAELKRLDTASLALGNRIQRSLMRCDQGFNLVHQGLRLLINGFAVAKRVSLCLLAL